MPSPFEVVGPSVPAYECEVLGDPVWIVVKPEPLQMTVPLGVIQQVGTHRFPHHVEHVSVAVRLKMPALKELGIPGGLQPPAYCDLKWILCLTRNVLRLGLLRV